MSGDEGETAAFSDSNCKFADSGSNESKASGNTGIDSMDGKGRELDGDGCDDLMNVSALLRSCVPS